MTSKLRWFLSIVSMIFISGFASAEGLADRKNEAAKKIYLSAAKPHQADESKPHKKRKLAEVKATYQTIVRNDYRETASDYRRRVFGSN